jgi:hypothetical protein
MTKTDKDSHAIIRLYGSCCLFNIRSIHMMRLDSKICCIQIIKLQSIMIIILDFRMDNTHTT